MVMLLPLRKRNVFNLLLTTTLDLEEQEHVKELFGSVGSRWRRKGNYQRDVLYE
jgi:hypothetical protein